MNIVVPMAGRGSRLKSVDPVLPKPLVQVAGQPMIFHALKSIADIKASKVIFVALREMERDHGITDLLSCLVRTPEVILIDEVTEGQLCTVMMAERLIDSDEDLLVASCDTYVESQIANDISSLPNAAGIISVADLPGDHWSFAKTDVDGRVVEVSEKRRISTHASTGLYYFRCGSQFVDYSRSTIRAGERTANEFYVMPVYQKYVRDGFEIRLSFASAVHDMGNIENMSKYQQYLSSKAT